MLDVFVEAYNKRDANALVRLMDEHISEVDRAVFQVYGRDQIKGTIEEELYDVLYYVTCLANVYDIDLENCHHMKEAINKMLGFTSNCRPASQRRYLSRCNADFTVASVVDSKLACQTRFLHFLGVQFLALYRLDDFVVCQNEALTFSAMIDPSIARNSEEIRFRIYRLE